jgi:thiosulfate reductase cytochrome b subunit
MVGSGWLIYNPSPIFPFAFQDGVTLGGDVEAALHHNDPGVASAIAWNFAAMLGLAASYPSSSCGAP